MPTASFTKDYEDGTDFTEEQLDAFRESVENFLNVTKLDSDNIQTGGISSNALATSAVTTAKIAADAVTTAKIADSNVTTAKINDSAVTTAKINDSAVTTAKINTGAVTQAKLASRTTTTDGTDPGAGGVCISTSSSTASVNSETFDDVTNLSCTLTTLGRPVRVELIPDGSANPSYVGGESSFDNEIYIELQILRGASVIGVYSAKYLKEDDAVSAHLHLPCSSVSIVDTPAAGTYVYKLQARRADGDGAVRVYYSKLMVYEI
jgi:hypothetical protein